MCKHFFWGVGGGGGGLGEWPDFGCLPPKGAAKNHRRWSKNGLFFAKLQHQKDVEQLRKVTTKINMCHCIYVRVKKCNSTSGFSNCQNKQSFQSKQTN